ncbi:MAG TPA: BON domain-containing protein [Steroidobacteraceae bacterium]|jgi:osmotically-inducible protein OsmY|nr:BON domain-containing protein [Steroidobacteraceae bacterium]
MNKTNFRHAFIALLAAVVFAGCAAVEEREHCGAGGCPGDDKITEQVEAAFEQHTELRPPNIVHVQTLGGVVYLNGQVSTDLQRSTAVSVAKSVPGVKKVVDNLNLPYQGR